MSSLNYFLTHPGVMAYLRASSFLSPATSPFFLSPLRYLTPDRGQKAESMLSALELHRILQKSARISHRTECIYELHTTLSIAIDELMYLLHALAELQIIRFVGNDRFCLTDQGVLANLDIWHEDQQA